MLDGIDLDVRAGTVFSLLGPNGAGKTTTVNVLTTLMKADGGTACVAGHDVATEAKAVRAVIGVTGQFAAVDDLLTGQENLQLMADLHHLRAGEGKRVVTSLLERFDLAESAQKMAATYSGGMRRKLDLAMTLVTRPQIIFLDEPTTGLDRVPPSTGSRPSAPRPTLPAAPSAAGKPSAARHSPRRRALTPNPVDERRLRDCVTWFEREGDQEPAQPGARHVGEDVVRANLE